MKISCKNIITSTICALSTLGFVASANAATFTDRSTFQAAAGALDTETFEGAPNSGTTGSGALPSIDFDDFTVSSTPNAVKVIDTTFFGAMNTTSGGKNFLYLDTDIGFVSSLSTFVFDGPITAFGFDLTGFEGGTVTIGAESFVLAAGNQFFGFTSAIAFSSFTLDTAISQDSGYGLDDLSYSALDADPVPVPGAIALFGTGLAAFAAQRARKKKATA